jgi:4-amino-4-deoxy-L-arabinose transferase-like glycosyltransferase
MTTLAARAIDAARRRTLAAILTVGFLLRLAWLLNARPDPVSDFLVYQRIAERMLDDGFIGLDEPSAFWLPGYPAFLALLSLASRATFWLSLVMVAMSTAMCWIVHRLARSLGLQDRVALVAAGLCAVAPPFVTYSPILGTEHLFVPLTLGTFIVATKVAGEVSWRIVAAGALLGLSALVRGEALFYAPVVLVIVWVATDRKRRLAASGLLIAGVVAVLAPWVARNMVVVGTGPALGTVGGMNFYFAHNPDTYGWTTDVPWTGGDDLEANRVGWELGLEYVRENPLSLVDSTLKGLRKQFSTFEGAVDWGAQRSVGPGLEFERVPLRGYGPAMTAVVFWTAISLTLTGASLLLWRRWPLRMRLVVIGMTVTNLLGYTVLFFGDPRFRYTLDAVFAIPAALALVALWDSGRSASSPADPQHA